MHTRTYAHVHTHTHPHCQAPQAAPEQHAEMGLGALRGSSGWMRRLGQPGLGGEEQNWCRGATANPGVWKNGLEERMGRLCKAMEKPKGLRTASSQDGMQGCLLLFLNSSASMFSCFQRRSVNALAKCLVLSSLKWINVEGNNLLSLPATLSFWRQRSGPWTALWLWVLHTQCLLIQLPLLELTYI